MRTIANHIDIFRQCCNYTCISHFHSRIAHFGVVIFYVFLVNSDLESQIHSDYSLRPIAYFDGVTYVNIFFSEDQKNGWICGEKGVVLVTRDGGVSWKDISPYKSVKDETQVAFNKIIFNSDNRRGCVIGNNGVFYTTTDGGESWIKSINLRTRLNLRDVHFSSNNNTLRVLNTYGEVFESIDYGRTWKEKISLDYVPRSFLSTNNSFLVGAGVGVYAYNSSANRLIDISLKNESEITGDVKKIKWDYRSDRYIAVHDSGFVVSYKTNGKWEKIGQIDSLAEAYDICFDETGKIMYVIGDYSKIFKSTDGGKEWSLIRNLNHNGFDLFSITCSRNGKVIWICGTNRTIMYSTDYGLSWEYKTGSYTGDSYSSLVSNNFSLNTGFSETHFDSKRNLLWSVGEKGLISSTDLAHLKSKRLSPNETLNKYFGLHFGESKDVLFAVGENLKIARYSLSSKKTETVYEKPKSKINLYSICFNTEGNIGIAVGQESSFVISYDGGKSWKEVRDFLDDFVSFSDICFRNNTFFIVGERGMLIKYNAEKSTWTKHTVGDSTEFLESISFSDKSETVFITTSGSKCRKHLYKSDDNGSSWSSVKNFPNYDSRDLQNVKFNKTTDEVFVTDNYGEIYKSNDRGLTWFKIFPKLTNKYLTDISFDSNNNPVFSGGNGTFILCKKKDNLPKISEFEVEFNRYREIYKPKVTISDAEQGEKLIYSVSILTELKDGSDSTFKQRIINIGSKERQIEYPKDIFVEGKEYTFRLTVFDGWNIVSKEISVKVSKTTLERFAEYMGWVQSSSDSDFIELVARNTTLLGVLYAIIVLFLFTFSPGHFIIWHETVANSNLPFPEKLSKIFVLYLIKSDRCVDAFVKSHKERAVELFNSHPVVKSRSEWVKAPFNIDNCDDIIGFLPKENQKTYIPGLSEIQQKIRKERVVIRIEGQGGFGKTSLGIQLCRWAFDPDKNKRLFPWTCIPIFIDKIGEKNLDDACQDKINYLCDSRGISRTLFEALLEKKRVIVMVDGVSEMPNISEEQYSPEKGSIYTRIVVFTARKPLTIHESTVIYPMGAKIDFLDMLLDSFTNIYAGAYKFGDQREVLRNRVIQILLELNGKDESRPIALSLLREIVKQASKLVDEKRALNDFLPKSVGELYDNYIRDLFISFQNAEAIVNDLRKASLISIGLGELLGADFSSKNPIEIKPMWFLKSIYNKYILEESIRIFLLSGTMNTIEEVGLIYMKFKHDPIAEYLACVEIINLFKQGAISMEQVEFIIDSSKSIPFNSLLKTTASRMHVYVPS